MSYYGDSQWPAGAQPTAWDHQTPPNRSGLPPNSTLSDSTNSPADNARPGASSTIPREEASAFGAGAFWNQFEGTSPGSTSGSNTLTTLWQPRQLSASQAHNNSHGEIWKRRQFTDQLGMNADRITEVERAIENLVKSGKMFGPPGGRREFQPPFPPGPARLYPDFGEYTICQVLLAGS